MSSRSEAPLRESWLKVAIPLALGAIVLLAPTPAGLPINAWRYFALFVTVIAPRASGIATLSHDSRSGASLLLDT